MLHRLACVQCVQIVPNQEDRTCSCVFRLFINETVSAVLVLFVVVVYFVVLSV